MAARHVMYAAIVARGIIQSNPTGEMGHWLRPRPVGIVLMPGHNSAMMRWFVEDLIVPETHRPGEPLRSRNDDPRIPEQIMNPAVHRSCFAGARRAGAF